MKNLRVVLSVAKVVFDLLIVMLLVLYLKEFRENALTEIDEMKTLDKSISLESK